MKSLCATLVLALAAVSFAQAATVAAAAARASATPAVTAPAPTLDAYFQQLRQRYQIPEDVITPRTQPQNRTYTPSNLLMFVAEASRRGIPLDVLEDVGGARARFLSTAQASLQKLRDSVGDLDQPAVQAKTASLKDQRDKALLELEVKKTKEASIQSRIDKITQEIALKTDSDEILKALRKSESIRKQRVEDAQRMAATNTVPRSDVEAAELELAAATIDIAKRRAEIAATAFGGALDTLNKALIEVSLDVEEQQAAVQTIDRRLNDLKHADEALDRIRTLDTQIQILKELQTIEQSLPPATRP
jgi:hypothetical protein